MTDKITAESILEDAFPTEPAPQELVQLWVFSWGKWANFYGDGKTVEYAVAKLTATLYEEREKTAPLRYTERGIGGAPDIYWAIVREGQGCPDDDPTASS